MNFGPNYSQIVLIFFQYIKIYRKYTGCIMYISFLILQIFISNKNQKERNFQFVQLVAKKIGNENSSNVNLVLSICQLIVYLTTPIKYFF
jgi:hypothetical protein